MSLGDLRCACGSPDVVVFDPGQSPERAWWLLQRGRPTTGRCLNCWRAAPALAAAE